MSETATAEPGLTSDELAALKALLKGGPAGPRPGTVEVDSDEYGWLQGLSERHKRLQGQYDLASARMRELEGLLRREQADHQQECDAMLKRIKSLGG
jgi:hypothetical protein